MFREMRRKQQALTPEECAEILRRGTSGVLAVLGDGGYPYAAPLSYAYDGEKIFFHCAKSGHKLDAIRQNSKVSFCVIDQDQIVPAEYTTYFRSVIVFGTARILTQEDEMRGPLEKLAARYAPDDREGRKKEIERESSHKAMIELTPDNSSGKEAIEQG